MAVLKELREKADVVAKEMYRLRDIITKENRDLTTEEEASWKKANEDYDRLAKQIDVVERADKAQQRMESLVDDDGQGRDDSDTTKKRRRLVADNETRKLAFQGWCLRQMDMPLKKRHIEACKRTGLQPHVRQLKCRLADTETCRDLQRDWNRHHESTRRDRTMEALQKRALSNTTMSAGAATIPDSFITNLELAMLQFGGVRAAAEILRTETGEEMTWPTANDTGNKGRRIGANTAVATNVDPTTAQVKWNAYKYTSDAVLVPYELLEDSAFDLASMLGTMLGERLGRITADENTTGTGNSMPYGIVTRATTFGAAGASAITYDDLVKLEHSVDPAYRNDAAYMMHDSILLLVRLLKDSTGVPLWVSNIRDGVADRFNGRPYFINQSMDSTAASGKKTVLFGQFSKFKIREVKGIRLYRLQERYRDSDQDGFVAFLRQDANLLDAGVAPVKVLLH